jgi:hypothetical protein
MFTLIITVVQLASGSVAITSVPGFQTGSACELAAQEWTHRLRPAGGSVDYVLKITYSTACVSMG